MNEDEEEEEEEEEQARRKGKKKQKEKEKERTHQGKGVVAPGRSRHWRQWLGKAWNPPTQIDSPQLFSTHTHTPVTRPSGPVLEQSYRVTAAQGHNQRFGVRTSSTGASNQAKL
jgi:hypothetical protein